MEKIAKIHIKDLRVDCILGVNDIERAKKQEIIINISLTLDAAKAIETDDIHNAVNYRILYEDVIELVQNPQFHLLETLANAIGEHCMKDTRVLSATVSVEKPAVFEKAKGVVIEIIKRKEKDQKLNA